MRYTCFREGIIRVVGSRMCSPGSEVEDLKYRVEVEVDLLHRGFVLEISTIPEIVKKALKGKLSQLSCEQIAAAIVKGVVATFKRGQRNGELIRIKAEVSPMLGDVRGVSVEWIESRDYD